MKTLSGNTILVIDNDQPFVERLKRNLLDRGATSFGVCFIEDAKTILLNRDVEFIICSYYVADGLIHQLIDWCRQNLDLMPIFVSFGLPSPTDIEIQHRHLISAAWEKTSSYEELIDTISLHAFNQADFKRGIEGLIEPKGVILEVITCGVKKVVRASEIVDDGIFISDKMEPNSFAILRFSIFEADEIVNFNVLGSFLDYHTTGQKFCVFAAYQRTWEMLVNVLEERQLKTTKFLKKVSGY